MVAVPMPTAAGRANQQRPHAAPKTANTEFTESTDERGLVRAHGALRAVREIRAFRGVQFQCQQRQVAPTTSVRAPCTQQQTRSSQNPRTSADECVHTERPVQSAKSVRSVVCSFNANSGRSRQPPASARHAPNSKHGVHRIHGRARMSACTRSAPCSPRNPCVPWCGVWLRHSPANQSQKLY